MDDIARLKNTHLMDWLKDGWTHCRHGSQDWCQGYLSSAHEYIEALESQNSAFRSDISRLTKERDEAEAWRPIATAPKDGTFVLVHAAAPIPRVAMAAWQGRGQRAGWYGVDDCGLTFDAVRHGDVVSGWKPLPAIRQKSDVPTDVNDMPEGEKP